jgi:hypothetical protein
MKLALALSLAVVALSGCSDDPAGGGGAGGTGSAGGDGGGSTAADGGSTATSGATGSTTSDATSTAATSVSSGGGSSSSGDTSSSTGDTSASATATVSTGATGGGTDLHAAERAACVAHINELRATKGAYAYEQWGDGETCADEQATSDEEGNEPHGAFGSCGESAQNECLGHGVAGIIQCLDQMWAEKDLAGCAGCDACALGDQAACAQCDFFGQDTGDVCGHYVNMRSLGFSQAACGFSTAGGWDVINFR